MERPFCKPLDSKGRGRRRTKIPNDFYRQDNSALIHVAQTLVNVAGDDPRYAIPPATATAISGEATALQSLALQWVQAEATLRGLTDQKLAARNALISKLGMTVKTLEGNPVVTDAILRAAALAPRPSRGARPQAIPAPAALVVEGFSDGTLALKWTPQGRTRTTFVVETSADGQAWSYLATTQRRTLKAPGFAPGQAVYARVFAVNSTLSSPASNVASVYAPIALAAVQLRVA